MIVNIGEKAKIIKIEVGIIDPSDMEESVAVNWFGVNPAEWQTVTDVMAKGTRVLFYVWEAYTSERVRVGSFVLTRRCDCEGGMLRLLGPDKAILRQDHVVSDYEGLELISQWVAALGLKWPMIHVGHGSRSTEEQLLAWDFTSLLEHRRAGKTSTPIRHLPIPAGVSK